MLELNTSKTYTDKEEKAIHSDETHRYFRNDLFLRLFMASRARIYAFILSLIHNWTDAEDIMQDTATIMWRKFPEFKLGTNFVSWGVRIAYYEVLKYRKKQYSSPVEFDDEILNKITDYASASNSRPNENLIALQSCLSKLHPKDFRLIQLRYREFKTVKDLAHHVERSVQGLYKSLARIHSMLVDCIRRKLAQRQII
jgi:RNA polymerase sigma-70 factor (ECF subfamily)